MPLVRLSVCVLSILAICDVSAQQAVERRVPVGTSEIAGIVTAADTGLPIRGACVSLSGEAALEERTTSTPDSSVPPSGPRTATVPPIRVASATAGRGNPQPIVMDRPEDSTQIWRKVFTDEDGRFAFPRLPAGRFSLSVSHRHYFDTDYGQRRPNEPGRQIQVTNGGRLTLTVRMTKAAVVTGRVIGPDGEPQREADVRFSRVVWDNGFRRLERGRSTSTDDRGIYRMFGLLPGDYVVSAVPDDLDETNAERDREYADSVEKAIISGHLRPPTARGLLPTVAVPISPETNEYRRRPPYVETFAPSASAPSSAMKLTLVSGEEKTGVDICVRLARAGVIEGAIQTALDPGTVTQLWLVSDDPTIDGAQSASGRSGENGRFSFWSVPPGNYTIVAQIVAAPTYANGIAAPAATNPDRKWGRAQVTVVGGAVAQVSVSLQPARSISGVVVFDLATPSDFTHPRYVYLQPVPASERSFFGTSHQAQVGPDGRFAITGVGPGRYVLHANGGGMTKTSIIGGRDTLDCPYEFTGDRDVADAVVTLTNTMSELSGTLTDGAGKPADDVTIVVAASDTRYWTPGSRRVVVTRPGPDGRYSIRGLPPGAYLIAAVKELEYGAQYDLEFLRSLAGASVPVTIMEGAKVTQNLRVK